jgi:hypothetical protein
LRSLIALVIAALLVPSGMTLAAARKKRSTAKKGTAAPAARKGSSARKPAATATTRKGASSSARRRGTTASKKGRSTRGAKKTAQSWRSRQLRPTPERYREIQQALIDKGYLQAPATGTWDQTSTDALRRFQQNQHLDSDGKIDSLSLIALGLGPKYDTTTAVAPPPVPPASNGP